jgi:L-aminopeptidase/D-esterase-like protein
MDRRRFGLGMAGAALAGLFPPFEDIRDGGGDGGLTDVTGLKVGHFTDTRRPTGCTVVLAEAGAVCGVDVRGGAPGTRETDLLDPVASAEAVHGIVLSGGSAFGLDAASGVVRFLEERKVGVAFGGAVIPIVPAAILFDLRVGDPLVRPDAAAGYAAARAASAGPVAEGSVGVGAGATVGKLLGPERAMKSGVGTASHRLPKGAIVAALVVVNAAGDVVDPTTGRPIAGARTDDGRGLAGAMQALLSGRPPGTPARHENTTLGIVATNVTLNKAEATKVAQMAHDGLARTIYPVHTPVDGDTLFALSTAQLEQPSPTLLVGAVAAEVVARAVLRAVRLARGLPGLPSISDLARP